MELEIRDLTTADILIATELLDVILQLDAVGFPPEHRKLFLEYYGLKWAPGTQFAKVGVIGGQVAGIIITNDASSTGPAFLDDAYVTRYELLKKQVEALPATISDPDYRYAFQKQLDIVHRVDELFENLTIKDKLYRGTEIRMLAVFPQFQKQRIAAKLVRMIRTLYPPRHMFWLVTDSNCNWKYYEHNSYLKLAMCDVPAADGHLYHDLRGQTYYLMIYFWRPPV